ncbi:MAG TPA: dockerin type I domain-containing protein [Candidatus Angelobacter sp.]|nr:dockerin type I domain-containing protein [Candidatus Angelobacter sp.]
MPPLVETATSVVPNSHVGQSSVPSPSPMGSNELSVKPGMSGMIGSGPVNIVSSFEGLNQTESCTCIPPDVQVATGPNHVFEMVNRAGRIFSKQGALVQSLNLTKFFLTGNDSLTDPKVLFDQISGRWFASILAGTANFSVGNVTIAVSSTSDPSGMWNIYVIPTGLSGILPDQPILGVSDDKVDVSANDFSGPSFKGGQYWILNKSEMTAGVRSIEYATYGPVGVSAATASPGFALGSVHPVDSLSPTVTQYMVSTGTSLENNAVSTNAVQLFAVTGIPPGNLTFRLFSLPVSTISNPDPGIQPGGNIDTRDLRVEDASWFQGKLWLTVNDSCMLSGDTGFHACIRLIEIDTAVPTVLQDFDFCAVNTSCFYGALRTDSQGNLAVIYGFSSSTIYPSLAVTGQAIGDPLNTLKQPLTLIAGTAINQPPRFGSRYGDYFGASVDPADQTLVWVAGEYINNSTRKCFGAQNCWSTRIGSIRVTRNDVSILNSPALTSFIGGSSGSSSFNLTITSLNSFIGTGQLLTTVAPSGPTTTLNTTIVNFANPGDKAAVKLTISTKASTSGGIYRVSMTVTTTSSIVPANLVIIVVGFTISANPTNLSVRAGSLTTSNINLASSSGFAGTVSLTSSASAPGISTSFNPYTFTLAAGHQATSILTLSTNGTTYTGLYVLTVTGQSGLQSSSASISVVVTPITFNVNNTQSFTGITVKTVESLAVDTPSEALTISGTVSIQATNSTTSGVLYSNSYPVSGFPIKSQGALYIAILIFNITAGPYPLASETLIQFGHGSPPATQLSVFPERNPDINENGIVDQPDVNAVSASINCSVGMSCYNPRADLNADGTVDANDASRVQAGVGFPNIIPSFSITADTGSLTIGPNNQGQVALTMASIGGFSGTVSLSLFSSPLGLSSTLSSSTISLSSGGTATSTLTASSPDLGFFAVNVTGTSGVVYRTIQLRVNVEDFLLQATPSEAIFPAGSSAIFSLTITSLFDFSSNLSLSTAVLPMVANGPGTRLGQGTVKQPLESTVQTNVTVFSTSNSPGASYSINVKAASGLISHTIVTTIIVENFNLSASSASLTISKGSAKSSNITVTSQDTFSGSVALTASVAPAVDKSPSVLLNPTSITLTSGGRGISVITVSASSITSKGSYTITVTATSGSLTHTASIIVTVT